MLVYLVVTADRFELPIYCGDNSSEVSKVFKCDSSLVRKCALKEDMIFKGRYYVRRVSIEEGDDEE